MITDGRNDEFVADRESRGERIEKSSPALIATVPPTLRRLAPAEFPVASLYSVADRRGRLLHHHGLLVVNRKRSPPPVLGSKDGGQVCLRSEGSAGEFSIVVALRKTGQMLPRAPARHRTDVAHQWAGRR